MDIVKESQLEHFKKGKNISSGIYYCQSCEVIFSAYYPREYSLNCLRSVNHGRCYKCREKGIRPQEKRLIFGDVCPKCRVNVNNSWQKMCTDELRKIGLEEFRKICRTAIKRLAIKINPGDKEIEFLYKNLSEKDFLSYARHKQSGLDQNDLVDLLQKTIAILNRRVNNVPIKEVGMKDFYEYCLEAITQDGQSQAISEELVRYVYAVICDQAEIIFSKRESRNIEKKELAKIISECSKGFRSKSSRRLAG